MNASSFNRIMTDAILGMPCKIGHGIVDWADQKGTGNHQTEFVLNL